MRRGAVAAFAAVLLLSGAVVLAWHLHWRAPIQLVPDSVPMPYNTALCLAVSSAAYLLHAGRRRIAATAAAASVALLGGLSLAQYLSYSDFGIDQLFMRDYLRPFALHPGRMSPVAAACFLLCAAALLFQLGRADVRRISVFCCALVFAIAAAGLAGYVGGFSPPPVVGDLTHVGLHTAIAFMVLSLGGLLWFWRQAGEEVVARGWWLPLPVGVAIAVAALMLWQALADENAHELREETRVAATGFESHIKHGLDARLQGLTRIARRWERQGGTPHAEWQADVALHVAHYPGYQAIEWIDPTLHVRWIEPEQGNEAAVDLDIARDAHRRMEVEAARVEHHIAVTSVEALVQGGKGFVMQVPLFIGERFDGFIAGVFRVPDIFGATLRGGSQAPYAVTIYDGDAEVYTNRPAGSVSRSEYTHEFDLTFRGKTWRFAIDPTASLVAEDTSALPEVVLASGLGVALLIMTVLYATQVAFARARLIDATVHDLQKEIAERGQAEAALRESEARFHDLTTLSSDWYWEQDEEFRYTLLAGQAVDRPDFDRSQYIGKRRWELSDYVPNTPDGWGSHRAQLAARQPFYNLEVKQTQPDGSLAYLSLRGKPMFDSAGHFKGYRGTGRDITARKLREIRLRESEQRFEGAFRCAGIGIALVAPDGRWLQVNPAMCFIVGYTEAELVTKTFQEITHPEDVDADLASTRRLLLGKTSMYQMEKRYFHKDGHVVYVHLSVSLVRDDGGAPLYFVSQVQDISARKAVQATLAQSEQRLAMITDNVPALISYIDRDYRYRYANKGYRDWFGIELDALLGHSIAEFYGEEVFAEIRPFIDAALAGETTTYERDVATGTGRRRAHVTAVPHRGDDGAVQGLYVLMSDITQTKQTEEELRRANAFLDSVFDEIPNLAFVKDAKTLKYLRFNKAAEETMGMSKGEVIGRNDHDIFSLEDAETFAAKDREALAGMALIDIAEERLQTAHKGVRLLHTKKLPMFDGQGKPLYLLGISEDITERRQAELALERSERFLQAIIEAIPQPVFVKDRQHRWVMFNDAFCDMLEKKREQILGASDSDVHPTEVSRRHEAEDERVFAMGGPLFTEAEYHFSGGSRWLLKSKCRLTMADEQFLVGIITDITERRKIEERIEASLREKEVLLKEIHHRVKNNMQIISSLLQLQSGYITDPEVLEVFQESQTRIRAMALIHEKLYQTPDLALVDFGDYVRELLSMLTVSYHSRASNVKMEVRAEPILLDIDRAIPTGLILNELVSNGIKHAFPDGQAGTITIELQQEDRRVVLVVRDNGVGLPPQFEADKATSLGLRLVNVLTDQLNATLEASNAGGLTWVLSFDHARQAVRRLQSA